MEANVKVFNLSIIFLNELMKYYIYSLFIGQIQAFVFTTVKLNNEEKLVQSN